MMVTSPRRSTMWACVPGRAHGTRASRVRAISRRVPIPVRMVRRTQMSSGLDSSLYFAPDELCDLG